MNNDEDRKLQTEGRIITCTRRITFSAGHRIFGHESKCANFHGHNYAVELTAQAVVPLDSIGRVIDFGVLKAIVGSWVDDHLDHQFIISDNDKEARRALASISQPLYLMPDAPTAENLALLFLDVLCPNLLRGSGAVVVKVVVHETENCFAVAELSGADINARLEIERQTGAGYTFTKPE